MTERDRATDADGAADSRFLTFRSEERLYAVPADQVSEVVCVPPVSRVPQASPSLLGLANLRGSILPVASLRRLLGRPDDGGRPEMRAIVLDGGAPVALVVDRVEALVTVAADRVETRQAVLAEGNGERLQGAFQTAAGSEPTRILDVRALLETAFVPRERPPRSRRGASDHRAGPAADDVVDHPKLVTFEVAGQNFALPLALVREIVPAPDRSSAVPHGDGAVLGVVAYRDTLLPLLCLRGLLGLGGAARSGSASRVIVTHVHGALVGLVADRMRTILPADPARIEPIPPVLAARTGGEARIEAIYRGEELVSILSPQRLFREDVMQRLGTGREGAGGRDEDAGPVEAEESRFVVFRLGDGEFGLPVEAVEEVARLPDRITRVPRTPAFLEGVVNLRGEVLPVVDQRRRFDMPPSEAGEVRRLLVVRTQRHRAGLIVDAVTGVLPVARDAVEPAPDLTGETNRLVHGVVNLEATGRIVLLLDPAELLSRAERGLLDAFADETAS
ncbi:MAG TPA: chemotaxis protein CheW [Salinarimonas sp.]|nr:chemotaxis protein CheW [Salinarimonas sp.]